MSKASFRKALVPAFLVALAVGYIGKCDPRQKVEEPTTATTTATDCDKNKAIIEDVINQYAVTYGFKDKRAQYLKENLCNALAVEEEYGIPTAAVIAKAVSEHGFGQDEKAKPLIEKARNHVGVKYKEQYADRYPNCIDKETWEVKTENKETACFVVYPNAKASYLHFGEFLATRQIGNRKPYESVMEHRGNSSEFLRALADSDYSTNPNEFKLTKELLDKYHLDELVADVKRELQKKGVGKGAAQTNPTNQGQTTKNEKEKRIYDNSAFSLTLHSTGFRQGDLIVLELEPKKAYDATESTLEFKVKKEDGKERVLTLPKIQKNGKIYALLGTDFTYPPQEAILNVNIFVNGSSQQQSYEVNIAPRSFMREDLYSKTTRNAKAQTKKAKEEAAAENNVIGQAYGSITKNPYFISEFKLPVNKTCKAESFGSRRFIDNVEKSRHKGVDCKGSIGDIISTPLSGKVELAVHPKDGAFSYMGNHTMLNHGYGLYTLYGHQTIIAVNKNGLVQTGQQLGTIGETGRASGPHLHWQAYLYKMKIDPLSLEILGKVF